MHDTAAMTGDAFFRLYGDPIASPCSILDVGSLDVNGTLRPFAPMGADYCGIDREAGPGVDRVGNVQSEKLGSRDLVVSTSCLEHDEFFWLTFLAMCRTIKPDGFVYISAPVDGPVHRHPVDCWRFYPDAGASLQRWAELNGTMVRLRESFLMPPWRDVWTDFVAVFSGPTAPERPFMHQRFTQAREVRA